MTFSHSENDTPSNLHARRAPMVVCPLGMHRIPPFLIALPQRNTLTHYKYNVLSHTTSWTRNGIEQAALFSRPKGGTLAAPYLN